MKKLTQKDIKEVRRLYSFFPKEISVRTYPSKDGGFCAEIETFPGCNTQGETFAELVAMVNDCRYSYLDIPEKFLKYMPDYLAPISVAQKFGIFPRTPLKLQKVTRELVKS